MKSLIALKSTPEEKEKPIRPLARLPKGPGESVLTPVTLSGVVLPLDKELSPNQDSQYKLVCSSGLEYLLVTNEDWRQVLSWYCWEDVKVVGLLNTANLTLIPQRVFPKGPKGQKEKVIDLALWKSREAIKKLTNNVNDLILVPAAVLAVAGFDAFR